MKSTDLTRPLSAHALNESMFKQFNVKIDFNKYDREQLENYRNLLRSKVHATETQANFNDLLTNETYQKDKYMLGVLNTKIKEMLGEGKKVDSFVANVKKSEKKAGKSDKKATDIAWATANKKGMLDNKNKKTNEAAKPDFLDVDKDGNKKETFKKAVADKKKNPFKKTTEAAKPDFLDMDKDGNKKETFKKAVADKKKNPFKKTTEATKPLKGGQKKLDTDKDGDIDAKDMKNLRAKKKAVKESKRELMHQAYQKFISEGIASYIAEDEEGKAKSITAAADMVNDFTSWMQRVGNYQTKSMIELADNIRANFGMQEAEQFKAAVGQALEGALNSLTTAREEINNAVAVLAGEAPAQDQMGMDGDMAMPDAEAPDEFGGFEETPGDDMNVAPDEFAASDAAAGGPETTGRMKRESIERGNRLMKILGS
jgi:hypothetical protein